MKHIQRYGLFTIVGTVACAVVLAALAYARGGETVVTVTISQEELSMN